MKMKKLSALILCFTMLLSMSFSAEVYAHEEDITAIHMRGICMGISTLNPRSFGLTTILVLPTQHLPVQPRSILLKWGTLLLTRTLKISIL